MVSSLAWPKRLLTTVTSTPDSKSRVTLRVALVVEPDPLRAGALDKAVKSPELLSANWTRKGDSSVSEGGDADSILVGRCACSRWNPGALLSVCVEALDLGEALHNAPPGKMASHAGHADIIP